MFCASHPAFFFLVPHFKSSEHTAFLQLYRFVLWCSLSAPIYKNVMQPKTRGMFDSLLIVESIQVNSELF